MKKALEYLFENEGSQYTNDPCDPGGPTKFGVTLKSYREFTGTEITPEQIEALTISDVGPFYEKMYWEPLCCDELKDPAIATALFDSAVLYGIRQSARFAQKALYGNNIQQDGIIGPVSVGLLNKVNRDSFILYFRSVVLTHISNLITEDPDKKRYEKGWVLRAERLLTLVDDPKFNVT